MATQRYISTSFWDDEWIQTLDPSEKFLYLYFLTNPLTNIAGIYKMTIRRICFDTGFNSDTVGHIISKFEKAEKVFFFNKEWVMLPNWPKHQKIKNVDNNRKGINTILEDLPEDVFQFVITHGYKYEYMDDIQRGLKGLIRESNYINLNLNSNLNINTNIPPISPQGETNTNNESKPKQKRSKKEFEAPSEQQCVDYCLDKQFVINPHNFYEYYQKTDPPWSDIGGKPLVNWKNKMLQWHLREKKKNPSAKEYAAPKVIDTGQGESFQHMTDEQSSAAYARFLERKAQIQEHHKKLEDAGVLNGT